MLARYLTLVAFAAVPQACAPVAPTKSPATQPAAGQARHEAAGKRVPAPLHDPRERHLTEIRQLTFSGENAEGYFDATGKKLVFQARKGDTGYDCDQIFEFDLESGKRQRISTGKGRTTCAYYHAGNRRILYASTHLAGAGCPPEPSRAHGYVWPLYKSFDIFSVSREDPKDLIRLTDTPGYDAEATVCPANGRIIFTSVRDGDIELYSMNDQGKNVHRLTHRLGYDGGAFYSNDGKQIVWRAMYPETDKAKADYKELLSRGLVRPTTLELWVAKADGSDAKQLTHNGRANFAPYFFPDAKRVIWAGNLDPEKPRDFHLYAIRTDGTGQERITFSSRFNSFAMFSPDGKYLVFASNRANKKVGDTNLFLAKWVD